MEERYTVAISSQIGWAPWKATTFNESMFPREEAWAWPCVHACAHEVLSCNTGGSAVQAGTGPPR